MDKLLSPRRIIALIIFVLVGVGVRSLFFFPNSAYRNFIRQSPNWSYPRSYCSGVIAAQRDWLSHQSVINILGAMDGLAQDRRTGLTVLTFGCTKTPAVEGFCDGYNRVIGANVRWFGLPKNSRKAYESILKNPEGYFDGRLKTEASLTVIVDGNPVRLPNRSTAVSLTSVRNKDDKFIDYQLSWEKTDCITWPLVPVDNALSFFAAPTESDFLVVRGRNQARNSTATLVLDLRYGYWIELPREP